MTNAELAILSLLAEQPHHGYDLEQIISSRGMRDWTEIGFSSIYYLLNKLEAGGLVESQVKPAANRGPLRKVYHLTPLGQQAWRDGVIAALSEPQPCFSPFQLGLSNLPRIDLPDALEALHRYQAALEARLAYLHQRESQQEPFLPLEARWMFDLSQTLISAELDWIQKLIAQLEQGEKNDGKPKT